MKTDPHFAYRTMQEANVKPFEIGSIINLLPGSAEEAKKLIPSLEVSLSFEDVAGFGSALSVAQVYLNAECESAFSYSKDILQEQSWLLWHTSLKAMMTYSVAP